LINQVVTTILSKYQEQGVEMIESVYSVWEGLELEYEIPSSLFFLHNLLIELIASYKYYLDENIENKALREVSNQISIHLELDQRHHGDFIRTQREL
jgi:hypothetical protein